MKELQRVQKNQEIVVQNLLIKEDIEEDSIVEAKHLEVKGIVYQDSSQYVREAILNIHKGNIRCHHVSIEKLKDGEVHATNAHIKEIYGGEVYAQNIYIENIYKPTTIVASSVIIIKSLKTSGCTFKINYKEVPILESKIELIEDDILEYTEKLFEAKKHNPLEVPHLQNKIQELSVELKIILNSASNANIEIIGLVPKENNIVFTVENKDIAIITEEKNYKSFHLDINNLKIIS